jgi:hypothetical protein
MRLTVRRRKIEGVLPADATYIKSGDPIGPGKPWMKVATGFNDPMTRLMTVTVSMSITLTWRVFHLVGSGFVVQWSRRGSKWLFLRL